MTNRSQAFAIFSEAATRTASTKNTMPASGSPATSRKPPMAAQTIVTNRVIAFMVDAPMKNA